jgi:hypothetical protein
MSIKEDCDDASNTALDLTIINFSDDAEKINGEMI